MLHPAYPVRTERLVLRPFTPDDLDDLHAIRDRPDVARYVPWEPGTRKHARQVLERKTAEAGLEREGDALSLAVQLPDGPVVGEVNLFWLSDTHRRGEIGFVFHPDHHGRGLAAEAVAAVLRLAFDQLGLHRVIGRCDERNPASARLMERLGLRREARLVEGEWFKGQWSTELIYAILEREWRDRTGGA